MNACKHRQHRQHLITSLAWIPRPSQTPSRQLQDPPYEPKIAQDLPQTASDPSKRPQDRPRILSRQLQGPPRRAEDRPRPLQDSLRLLKTSPRPPKILLDAPKKISSGTPLFDRGPRFAPTRSNRGPRAPALTLQAPKPGQFGASGNLSGSFSALLYSIGVPDLRPHGQIGVPARQR